MKINDKNKKRETTRLNVEVYLDLKERAKAKSSLLRIRFKDYINKLLDKDTKEIKLK